MGNATSILNEQVDSLFSESPSLGIKQLVSINFLDDPVFSFKEVPALYLINFNEEGRVTKNALNKFLSFAQSLNLWGEDLVQRLHREGLLNMLKASQTKHLQRGTFGDWLALILTGSFKAHNIKSLRKVEYVTIDAIALLYRLGFFFNATALHNADCELQSIIEIFQRYAEAFNLLPLDIKSLDNVVPVPAIVSFGDLYAKGLSTAVSDLNISLPPCFTPDVLTEETPSDLTQDEDSALSDIPLIDSDFDI
ncbi:hypothetical protein P9112_009322 [Eukaryota sp. TZLM1-RC]